MSDLLPCPFCGGVKHQVNTKAKGYFVKRAAMRAGKDSSNYLARCTKCGAKGPLAHSELDAIAAWNHRAPQTPALASGESKPNDLLEG